MPFEVLRQIGREETIASGASLRARKRLGRLYGRGRWRKLKGAALIRFPDGAIRRAELHWYEAHGIGKKEIKLKRYLD